MGILRSLGALARALGPILSATGERGPPPFANVGLKPSTLQSHKVVFAAVGTRESCTGAGHQLMPQGRVKQRETRQKVLPGSLRTPAAPCVAVRAEPHHRGPGPTMQRGLEAGQEPGPLLGLFLATLASNAACPGTWQAGSVTAAFPVLW